MPNYNYLDDMHYIYGYLFGISNKMDTILDRELQKFGITSKQWFLIVAISMFPIPPTLNEVAKEIHNSHQNIKQMALKLEQKGLLKMIDDVRDKRTKRLFLTEQNNRIWEFAQGEGTDFINAVFKGIEPEMLSAARTVMKTIDSNLQELPNHSEINPYKKDVCI